MGVGKIKWKKMVRLVENKDLNKLLELYIDLHEDSVPDDSDKRRICGLVF